MPSPTSPQCCIASRIRIWVLKAKGGYGHALQPSQSFFTELLTFIPRVCSCTPFTSSLRPAAIIALLEGAPIVGLRKGIVLKAVLLRHRKDIKERHECSDCGAVQAVVSKVCIVRRRGCRAIAGGGFIRLQPIALGRLRIRRRLDVGVLQF
jgi:hypothetical protein